MIIEVLASKEAVGKRASEYIVNQLQNKKSSTICFATGSSPLPMYAHLIELYKSGSISFAAAHAFNVDEYCGLGETHPQSFRYYMKENLFDHIDLPLKNQNYLHGDACDFKAEAENYEKKIAELGGIDLQILGIGENGHIGFNEPSPRFSENTQVVELTEETIAVNSRFFENPDEVPRYAITMGIREIMKARMLLMIATGKSKAEAVKKMIEGEITPACPASIIQQHENAVVLLDYEAASFLQ